MMRTWIRPALAALANLAFGRVLAERSKHVSHLADVDLLVALRVEVAENLATVRKLVVHVVRYHCTLQRCLNKRVRRECTNRIKEKVGAAYIALDIRSRPARNNSRIMTRRTQEFVSKYIRLLHEGRQASALLKFGLGTVQIGVELEAEHFHGNPINNRRINFLQSVVNKSENGKPHTFLGIIQFSQYLPSIRAIPEIFTSRCTDQPNSWGGKLGHSARALRVRTPEHRASA